jgi:hypothetical protein
MTYNKTVGMLVLPLIFALIFVTLPISKTSADTPADNLVISGLVSNPLNLTYGELEKFPMIWEIAQLQCVGATHGTPYNWTGIPLFYLLNLAKVQPGAKEIVFRAEDDFSSSLTIEEAMHPTIILALKVNGTTLPYTEEYPDGMAGGYPYRAVVPCKYGYKWVGWIDEIEVVDYDYKGTWESWGFSDDADIPNCTRLPETTPPYTVFNATWRETYMLAAFSKVTIIDASFNQTMKHIHLRVSSSNNSEGFVYTIVPKLLLTSNFTVDSDNVETQYVIQSETSSFLYFTLNQGLHLIEIGGMLLADVNRDAVVDMSDIGWICLSYGTTPSHERWDPNLDLNDDDSIDMVDIGIACLQYGKRNTN